MKKFFAIAEFAFCFLLPSRVPAQNPFQPNWPSLNHYTVPDWYRDAKFGIFIHWGVYSVPAYGNEWYPREMYKEGTDIYKHHIATYGTQDKFGYKDFIPMFKAEKFDPDQWAELFKKAGAKYVVPVAEHHDGFADRDLCVVVYDAKRCRDRAAKQRRSNREAREPTPSHPPRPRSEHPGRWLQPRTIRA